MISWMWHQKYRQQRKNKLGIIKIKNFYASKNAINSEKATHRIEENIFKSYT